MLCAPHPGGDKDGALIFITSHTCRDAIHVINWKGMQKVAQAGKFITLTSPNNSSNETNLNI